MKRQSVNMKRTMMMMAFCILTIFVAALGVALSTSLAARTPNLAIPLPACGPNPKNNTLALQRAIDNAAPGSTLVFSPGVCVVAKCDYANGSTCPGITGTGPHDSALYVGGRTDLTLVGAVDGTSVLKLDPNPPRDSAGHHGYCRDTHLLSIQGSSEITLRGFTVDGSDGELPEDTNQCANGNKIAEHMHDVYVRNSADITIDQMNITKAHGDGINLIANLDETSIPRTEHVSITGAKFLDNDRSGLSFQRNVGYVTVKNNYFKNSGDDQDLDMEATGAKNPLNVAPYEVEIDNNLFERAKPKVTVTLGSSGVQRSTGIRFTNNTIRPVSTLPTNQGGGCIFINGADNTTIENNTVIGGQPCVTLDAIKVAGLQIRNNRFESYHNIKNEDGDFVPRPVIRIREDIGKRDDQMTCGAPPKPPCPYFIHYPEQITIMGNTVIHHVQFSPGIALTNADLIMIADNNISNSRKIAPLGNIDPNNPAHRPRGIDLFFGVQPPTNGFFLNEKTGFQSWEIIRNRLSQFADSVVMAPRKATMTLSSALVNNNVFNTSLNSPRGIWLKGAPTTPENGFVSNLSVNANMFGCGFCGFICTPGSPPLSFAFVRPSGQAHTGNIGVNIACQ